MSDDELCLKGLIESDELMVYDILMLMITTNGCMQLSQ